MKKRVLAMLLVLCMMLTLAPGKAWAEDADGRNVPVSLKANEKQEPTEQDTPVVLSDTVASGTCGANLTWAFNGSTLTISGTGAMYGFEFASSQFNPPWSDYKDAIRNVIIESGVTSIGAGAFYKCTNLDSITIPNSVTSIGKYAFFQCAIRNIDLPASVKSIGSFAFDACKYLESIVIPAGVTRIEDATFWSCYALSEVILPDSLTYISGRAFSSCRNLTSIFIPSNITELSAFVFEGCTNLSSIYIPESVTSIGYGAFDGCKELTNIFYFGSEAQWEQIEIGSYNEYLLDATIHCNYIVGAVASGSCGDNLTWALDEAGTLSISGTGAMYDYLYVNDASLDTQPWRDYHSAIRTIRIGDGVTIIGHYAFAGCSSLTSVTIPDNVTLIRSYAFYGCSSLSKLTIPSSRTSIGNESTTGGFSGYSVFDGCISLTSAGPIGGGYDYEFGWTDSIPDGAFWGCTGLTSVAIPDSVTSIGYEAFGSCKSLTSVTIPDGVTSIGGHAFELCTSLSSVTIPGSVTYIDSVPAGSGAIGVFMGCTNLTSAGPIGGGYDYEFGWTESIPYGAFTGCSGLTSVTIPDSVTSIGGMAFAECRSLTEVTIPDGVTIIGNEEFWNCTSLSNVIIPDDVTIIRQGAFRGCTGLTSMTIPNSVTSIGNHAFDGCTGLTSVTISNGPTSIDVSAFSGCTALTYVIIPKTVTSISRDAFKNCDSITDIYFGGSSSDWDAISVGENNDILEKAEIHYNSTDPSQMETKTISGVLRSSDAGDIRWKCRYQIDKDGVPCNGRIDITMNNSNQTGELYLYNGSGASEFPWELSPYNIPKSAITKVVITGPLAGPCFRITANSFQGYDKLRTLVLDRVSGIDSYAFEGCTSLNVISRGTTDQKLKYLDKGAFKNCTKLAEMNFSGITTIGDEAFQNTAMRTITLGESITKIGANTFSGCINITIRCYENSTAHKYAQENKIPFELIKLITNDIELSYNGGATETFTKSLEDLVAETKSTEYSPELAHMLMTLSYAAYNRSDIQKSFRNLGFAASDTLYEFDENQKLDLISYSFAKKTLPNGQKLVLVVIKGSSNPGLHFDWLSNATINPLSSWHAGFHTAVTEVHTVLSQFLNNDFTNTTFVVTGHSRGAATANLLEIKLFEQKVPQSMVYGYNFACPDVAVAIPTMWNWLGEHNNMFNINAAGDPVSIVPGYLGDQIIPHLPGTSWGKFGMSRWFASNWNNLMETTLNTDRHLPEGYLEFLKKEPELDSAYFKTWGDRVLIFAGNELETIGNAIGKIFSVACPVDVQITDGSGKVIASVIDNTADYHGSEFGEVIIITSGDKKVIWIQDNGQPLTARLTATGSGEMEYMVQTVNINTSEVLSEKSFERVALTDGKEMLSLVNDAEVTGIGEDVSKVPLYILGDDGEPELKVLPDGQGTEVPLNTIIIAFDANGGSVTPSVMEVGAEGKLANLPVPNRSGYTFNGWYTATTGGTQITTSTVFDKDTTVYAHWTRLSGPVNSGGGSSGGSSSTAYAVDIPSVANGTITVNPKSAAKGSTVTITATPDSGYQLASLTVSDSSGKAITLTDNGNGKYTFTMPSGKVMVDATFQSVQTSETPWNNPFTDIVEGEWYYEAVRFVHENSLMNGYGDNLFAPNANLSRAMLAQILYNKEGRPAVSESNIFSDVASSAWYSNAVSWAMERGVVTGYGNGRFGPDDNITREQLVVMLWRYAGEPAATNKELRFSDADSASDYALDALRWATENGIINGKGGGILDPKGQTTRAQVAQMLKNYLDN